MRFLLSVSSAVGGAAETDLCVTCAAEVYRGCLAQPIIIANMVRHELGSRVEGSQRCLRQEKIKEFSGIRTQSL